MICKNKQLMLNLEGHNQDKEYLLFYTGNELLRLGQKALDVHIPFDVFLLAHFPQLPESSLCFL
jgi:hypothetical protein